MIIPQVILSNIQVSKYFSWWDPCWVLVSELLLPPLKNPTTYTTYLHNLAQTICFTITLWYDGLIRSRDRRTRARSLERFLNYATGFYLNLHYQVTGLHWRIFYWTFHIRRPVKTQYSQNTCLQEGFRYSFKASQSKMAVFVVHILSQHSENKDSFKANLGYLVSSRPAWVA